MSFYILFFFFKQKTAYEMRISDWSSDVCSSDLPGAKCSLGGPAPPAAPSGCAQPEQSPARQSPARAIKGEPESMAIERTFSIIKPDATRRNITGKIIDRLEQAGLRVVASKRIHMRSKEHTSELQSLMRNSYAVICLKTTTQTE